MEASLFIIKVEELYLVESTLKNAKQNLKKMEKVSRYLDTVNFKEIQSILGCFHPFLIYCEMWFVFIHEIVSIQKTLIDHFKGFEHLQMEKTVSKIKLLIKPKKIKFENQIISFYPPQIKLFVPRFIYNKF